MSIEVEELGKSVLELRLTGKLDREDYERFVPMAESLIENNGYISLIIHVGDFSGWTATGLWEDLRFDSRHYADVKRMALVGRKEGQSWLATLAKPFTGAEVAFFTEDRLVKARAWILEV